MIIKKIFSGEMDDEVHSDFLKFGRGEFKDKYLIDVKKQAFGWSIKTSAEFANFFVRKCLPDGRVHIKGVIISAFDLSNEIDFEIKKISNFQGVRKTEIDSEIESNRIIELMKKYPKVFFALSFKTPGCELKIKPKAPKSGKPGKNEEETKVDFCSLKTKNPEIVNELLFDVKQGFKEVKISHIIKIEKIVYPADFEKMKPEEVREKSKRIGVIARKVNVDGVENIEEAGFEA